jgi:hypothetical protein
MSEELGRRVLESFPGSGLCGLILRFGPMQKMSFLRHCLPLMAHLGDCGMGSSVTTRARTFRGTHGGSRLCRPR